mmetsp:Transcript_35453/g.75573  ORF Transcript_35453/g.75573 Transcript_35453/m.75573 type:complete len:432 (+) Transcript_35453:152-1447(+)
MSSSSPPTMETITVKVQGPPVQREEDEEDDDGAEESEGEYGTGTSARYDKESNSCGFEVFPEWLSSETCTVDKTQEAVVNVPVWSNIPRGLRMMSRRLGEETFPEGVAWTEREWVHASNGHEKALATALFLFDTFQQEKYCREICATMNRFHICCPEPFYSIAKQFDFWEVKPPLTYPPVRIDVDSLSYLVEDAVDGDGAMWALADRAVAAAQRADLQAGFMPAVKKLFDLEYDEETKQFGRVLEVPGHEWLLTSLMDAVKRDPPLAPLLLQNINMQIQAILEELNDDERDGCFSKSFVDFMRRLFLILFDGIFIQSHKYTDAKKEQREISAVVTDMFAVLEDLLGAFAKGFHMDPSDPRSDTFGIAPEPLQSLILKKKKYNLSLAFLIHGRVRCVHPMARHFLLGITRLLTKQDKEFLATAQYFSHLPQG